MKFDEVLQGNVALDASSKPANPKVLGAGDGLWEGFPTRRDRGIRPEGIKEIRRPGGGHPGGAGGPREADRRGQE
ncbi:MAG: hypothetical protein JO250_19125 [Armatimonadetes bacterium]|nr:hypothetical protein [Armatimonadota bacterium]